MNTYWFKNCKTPEDKEQVKKKLRSYKNVFSDLIEVLEDHYEEISPDYDCPSWSHKQADVNGANRKLQQIIKLITIKD